MVVLGLAAASVIVTASPSVAAECPSDGLLCRLLSAPTTSPTTVPPAPEPAPTTPALPPPTAPTPLPPAPATPHSAPEAARRLLDLVNGERSRAGLGRLTSRDDVVTIALAHSTRMATAGDIFHNDSYFTDSVQRQLNSRARGENVAHNTSVDDTHTRLMNSPGHRANILDPRFTVAGFAVVRAADGRYFTTQNFLQPAGAPVPPSAPVAAAATPRPLSATAAGVVTPAAAPAGVAPETTQPSVVAAAGEVTAATPSGGPDDPPDGLADLVDTGRGLAASSSPPGTPAGRRLATWLFAGVLLSLVTLGTVHVGREVVWRSAAPR